jgi:membrane protein
LISQRIRQLYQRADRISGNRLNILKDAVKTFTVTRANQAAASLAYYVIFSFFPLLLVLISAGSFFLNSQEVYTKVSELIQQAIPNSSLWINENLQQILEQRGTVGIIGLITLLWAASGGFINLAYNINLAWLEAPQRNFFQGRLVAFEMIGGLSGLFFLSLILDGLFNLLHIFDIQYFFLADDLCTVLRAVLLGTYCQRQWKCCLLVGVVCIGGMGIFHCTLLVVFAQSLWTV